MFLSNSFIQVLAGNRTKESLIRLCIHLTLYDFERQAGFPCTCSHFHVYSKRFKKKKKKSFRELAALLTSSRPTKFLLFCCGLLCPFTAAFEHFCTARIFPYFSVSICEARREILLTPQRQYVIITVESAARFHSFTFIN